MRIYLREAVRSLLGAKLRTLLALFGIVIGIGSVIALVSIGRIVTHEAAKQFMALGTDMVSVRLKTGDDEDTSLETPDLFRDFSRATHCIRTAAPFSVQHTEMETGAEAEEINLMIFGVTQAFMETADLALAAGRFPSDLDGARDFIVLGADMPARLGLDNKDPDTTDPAGLIGRELTIPPVAYTIIGILAPSPDIRQIRARVDESAFVPVRSSLKGESGIEIRQVLARMQPDADPAACVDEIRDYFYIRNPQIRAKTQTAADLIERMTRQTRMMGILLAAIGSISLIVGGVGIMNIMLVSVSERRQEIGIRRALGARRRDIRYQFLVESLLLSLAGGVIGILVGIGASYGVADFQDWEFFISGLPIAVGAGVSALIGVFFGFFPAHLAAKLDPITALRGE